MCRNLRGPTVKEYETLIAERMWLNDAIIDFYYVLDPSLHIPRSEAKNVFS